MRADCIRPACRGFNQATAQRGGTSTARLKSGAGTSWGKNHPRRAEIFAPPRASSAVGFVNGLQVDGETWVDQDGRVDLQAVRNNVSDPTKMKVFAIQLILAGPAGSGNDQAGNLLGGQFLRVDDDIEIAPVITVEPVKLEISFPILLVSLQGAIEHGFIGQTFADFSAENSFRPFL